MKHAAPLFAPALALALALAPLPAPAQDSPAPEVEEEGPSLMERGLSLFFEGFTQEMEPALDEMAKALEQLGPTIAPALESLMAMVDDMTTDMRPRLSAITAPLTVVIGQDERVLPPETSLRIYREAYAQARSVTLVPVARSAHFVMLDQPEAMLAALQGFLGS